MKLIAILIQIWQRQIIRITSGNVFNRLANTQEEDWDEVELSKLIKETNALIRATAYKKRVDIQNQDVKDTAIEEFKTLLFSTNCDS